MIGCLERPLTRPVLARSWCQAVLIMMGLLDDGTLERSYNRPQARLCVLRRRGSEGETRWTARAGMRSSTVIRNIWMQGAEKHQRLTSTALSRVPLRYAWLEVCRWHTSLARGSLSWELKAHSYGSTALSTPLDSNSVKMVRRAASALDHPFTSVSARPSAVLRNDDSREGV